MKVGKPPMVRIRNELRPLNRGPIDSDEMLRLLIPMMSERSRKIFEEEGGADFSHFCDVDGVTWRFRVNLLMQGGFMGLVARRVNNKIPDFNGLYLPASIESLCNYDQGMVLLAGVTGSEAGASAVVVPARQPASRVRASRPADNRAGIRMGAIVPVAQASGIGRQLEPSRNSSGRKPRL